MKSALLILAMARLSCVAAQEVSEPAPVFSDDFSSEALDEDKWVRTVQNDFEVEAVDIVGGRLRLAAATIGTDDSTVKFHGVRTKEPVIDLAEGIAISFDLDWHNQANGCYMTAGIYICPTEADNPRTEEKWLRLQYVGVPPGKNARCLVSLKRNGREEKLLTENWPQDREGRQIGLQQIEIVLDANTLFVTENGETILQIADVGINFGEAFFYLQHSTHSNYPRREVFFDNVVVGQ